MITNVASPTMIPVKFIVLVKFASKIAIDQKSETLK
jgi:hypothetical protein